MQYWDPRVFALLFPILSYNGVLGWEPSIPKVGVHGPEGVGLPAYVKDGAVAIDPTTLDNLTLSDYGRSKVHKEVFVSPRQYWRSLWQHYGDSITGQLYYTILMLTAYSSL